jgi:hypothetical protein
MGKIFRYDKPTLILVISLIFLILTTVHSYASCREYDLLQKGYESYLSYQPGRAAEEFRTFLQEFPRSSARDAALFWLGKSLMQSNSTYEAGQVFAELKRQFPDSPFVAFIVMPSEVAESEKLFTRGETEPVSQQVTSKDSADIRQSEPAGKTDDAITGQSMRTDTAASPETPAEKEAAAGPYPSESIQRISEPQAPIKSETDVRSTGDQGPVLSETETKPIGGMIAKGEEPGATQPEVIKTESVEPEMKEPALQKSEGIESAAELPPYVALPEIAPLDATPEPESVKAPETVSITKAGEQETASPQSEVSSGQAPDIMKKVEVPQGKESEVTGPIVKEPEVKEPAPSQEYQRTGDETKKQAVEESKEVSSAEEQAQSESAGPVMPKEEAPITGNDMRRDDEQVKTGTPSLQGTSESDTMTSARTTLNKIGIQGAILWSTGDRDQDFIDEQVLYNEAVKQNLPADEDELNGLRERYTLGIEEVDYLKRFLLICKLIDKKVKEIPGDKIVEVISVRYKDAGQREHPELAAELQALANKGVPFEDIGISYPDVVHFRTFEFQELPEWIQERIQGLPDYEVGVIWSEEGYMILKPVMHMYSYDPFEGLSSEKREKITAYIRSWIAELKGANTR